MTKILRDSETVSRLMNEFSISRVTVLAALDCKTKSALACKIRKRALDLGCQIKKEKNPDAVETSFDRQRNMCDFQ